MAAAAAVWRSQPSPRNRTRVDRISEEQAKKEVVIITRGHLGCDFDALPEYDVDDLWNHPAAHLNANRANGSFLL
jgi:hypothetical protein